MAAKTVIVGKVSIRVWPDTRLFRKTLEKDVKEATADVQGEVEVEPKVSETALRASLLEAIRKINLTCKTNPAYRFKIYADVEVSRLQEKLTKALSHVGSQSITIDNIKVAPNTATSSVKDELFKKLKSMPAITIPGKIKPAMEITQLNRELGKARLEMKSALGKVWVSFKTDLDPRECFRQVAKIKAKLKATAMEIRTKFETSKAMAKLRAITAKAKELAVRVKPKLDNVATRWVKAELAKVFDKTKVAVKTVLSKEGLVAARAKLAAFFKSTSVKVKAVLDNKSLAKVGTALAALSGGRMIGELFDYKALANLDKAAPKIALMATGIGQMASFAIQAVGNMLSLGRSIMQMAPAALALPGIFSGLAVMAVTTGVAFKDITKRIPALQGAFGRMAVSIRTAFWDNAQKPMASLVRTWLPMFDTGLAKVGGAMGGFFGNLSRDLKKTVSNRLPSWFNATAQAAKNFSSGTPGIAAIVKNLGNLGASILPRLTQWMADLANKFGAWLDAKAATGELNKMVETGITRMKQFGAVIGGAWGILDGLSKAAQNAGGTTLKSLATTLGKVSAAINSVQGQAKIGAVFAAAAQGMDELTRRAGPGVVKLFDSLASLLPNLLPAIGAVAGTLVDMVASALAQPEVGAGLMDFFVSLKSTLLTIGPAFNSVGRGIGGLASLLGVFLSSVAPLVNVALGALQQHTEGFLGAIMDIIPKLSGALLSVVNALLPAVGRIADVVVPLISQLGTAIAKIVNDAAPGIGVLGDGLATMFEIVGAALTPLIDLLGNTLGPILGAVGQWFGGVAVLVGNVAGVVIRLATAVLNWLLPPFAEFCTKWGPQLGAAIGNLGTKFSEIMEPLIGVANLLGPILQPIFSWLFDFLGGAILGTINGFAATLQGIADAAKWVMDALGIKLPTALNTAKDTVSTASSGINTSLDGIGTAVDGATTGLGSMGSTFGSEFASLASTATTNLNGIPTAIDKGTTGIPGALSKPVKKGITDIGVELAKVPAKVTQPFKDANGSLISSGESMMKAIAQGIRNATSLAVNAAKDAMDAVRRIFPNSPAKEGPFSGKGWTLHSGRAISESIGVGIRDEIGTARAAAEELMAATRQPLEADLTARVNGSKVASNVLATSQAEAPLSVGNITIGPDDPDYAEFIKFSQMIRRKRRQVGG